MPKLKPPEGVEKGSGEEENLEPIPGHPTWAGSISMGLVNIPVRAIPITIEREIGFRMLHRKCKTPISYKLFCEEGDEVPKSDHVLFRTNVKSFVPAVTFFTIDPE